MKPSLVEIFKTSSFLDKTRPILERTAALYYAGQKINEPEIQEQLKQLLTHENVRTLDEVLLNLHAAVMLAQQGMFQGVEYIVNLLQQAKSGETVKIAQTALRNCTRFPFAGLITQTINLEKINFSQQNLNQFLFYSEDQLLENIQQTGPELVMQQLKSWVDVLRNLPHQQELELGFGTVLSTPVRNEDAYRYSGFIASERPSKGPLIVPYDFGDLLNRSDSTAKQDITYILRRHGYRALVVYKTIAPYEAQQVYILPFGEQSPSQLAPLMGQLAREAEGLQIGLVFDLVGDYAYRVITRNGLYRWETYNARQKKTGSCVFIHENNSRSLSSDLYASEHDLGQIALEFKLNCKLERARAVRSQSGWISLITEQGSLKKLKANLPNQECVFFIDRSIKEEKEIDRPFTVPGLQWTRQEMADIATKFKLNTKLDLAVWVKSYRNEHTLVSKQGQKISIYGDSVQTETVYFVEEDIGRDGTIYRKPFYLPELTWSAMDRSLVLSQFFSRDFDTYGVVLMVKPHSVTKKKVAYIIHVTTKRILLLDVEDEVRAGTVAYIVERQQNLYPNVVSSYQITGGCQYCFGTKHRACYGCTGVGSNECHDCHGSQRIGCLKCSASGTIYCERCNGTKVCSSCTNGYWRGGTVCKVCNGDGVCKKCNPPGSGLWNCNQCHGKGTIRCENCKFGRIECSICTGGGISNCSCNTQSQVYLKAL